MQYITEDNDDIIKNKAVTSATIPDVTM
jgi:hypothetical protein